MLVLQELLYNHLCFRQQLCCLPAWKELVRPSQVLCFSSPYRRYVHLGAVTALTRLHKAGASAASGESLCKVSAWHPLSSVQSLTEEIQYLLEGTKGENGAVTSRVWELN